jgi:mRNA interferase RelE/StbE
MPEYKIQFTKSALKQLDRLPDVIAETLLAKIHSLAKNPRPTGCKKLSGRDGYRVRQADYRIIYDVFDNILLVEVIAVGHRKEIYN